MDYRVEKAVSRAYKWGEAKLYPPRAGECCVWAADNREKGRPKTWTLEAVCTGVERICNVQREGGRCIDGNGSRLPSALEVEPMEESSWRLKYEGIRDKFQVGKNETAGKF